MKHKLKAQFVCIKPYKNDYVDFKVNEIYKIGEMILNGIHTRYRLYLDIYGGEYVIETDRFTDLNERLKEHFLSLAAYREKRIDEILNI